MDGTETGVAPGPDVLTGASAHSEASQTEALDLYSDPAGRQKSRSQRRSANSFDRCIPVS